MIEEFERHLRGTNLSENTISSYLFAIRQYSAQYDGITKKNLRAYKVWLIENYKPKTVNLRLRAINCYLESIGKESWKMPFVRVQQKAFLENVISEADYEYFKTCLKRDNELFWYFVIRFLAATGARVSELIQIKVEHIKLGHLDLYSKGGKLRRIYIPKALQNEALSWLNDKHQESGFIFLNKYGDRITTRGISGQLKKLAVRYGIDPVVVYPHSFRHRFAKSFLERCNDIAFLADLMGHESIETTRIYLRKTSTEQRAIVDEVIRSLLHQYAGAQKRQHDHPDYFRAFLVEGHGEPHGHADIGAENNAFERYGIHQVVHRYLCGFVLQRVYADRQHLKQDRRCTDHGNQFCSNHKRIHLCRQLHDHEKPHRQRPAIRSELLDPQGHARNGNCKKRCQYFQLHSFLQRAVIL